MINDMEIRKNVFISNILAVLWDHDIKFKESHKIAEEIKKNLEECFFIIHKRY